MKTNIGISETNAAEVAHELSKLLADEFVLYTKARNAHWNVEGPDFINKHLFFETQYNELADIVDNVAERIRQLGHYAPATLGAYLELTELTEVHRQRNDGIGFIKELLEDHEHIIFTLRKHIEAFARHNHDEGTSDFITGLMEKHEKMAWFLRAHLQ